MTSDKDWSSIVLDIQHLITLAGADPSKADVKLLKNLTAKMLRYLKK